MKIAVIVHLYYTEMWHELAHCLRSFNDIDFDLFITTCSSSEDVRQMVCDEFPCVHYEVVENRGYDIAPFIKVLNQLDLDKYDFIAKLHTKRNCAEWVNYCYMSEKAWRRCLLNPFSSKKSLARALKYFEKNKNVGMVASALVVVRSGDYLESEEIRKRAESVISRLNLNPQERVFVAGTMFLVRAECLKVIQNKVSHIDFSILGDTEKLNKTHISDMSHVYERVFGYLISAQNMSVSDYTLFGRCVIKFDIFRKYIFLFLRQFYRIMLKPLVLHK